MLACELPAADIDSLFRDFADAETSVAVDLAAGSLEFSAEKIDGTRRYQFNLSEFEKALVEAGGWVNYAEKCY
jgi:3-isopropylmalate/(R)-2-methylmalate dehydratase small subunit